MRTFENTYTDEYGKEVELTQKELDWFYGIVKRFCKLEEAKNIEIYNRNHELMDRRNRDAIGLFYTDEPKNTEAPSYITIDNYFIHVQFEHVFNGGENVSFDTLENAIAHEIAHRYQFRHCKRHARITEEILEKYNRLTEKEEKENTMNTTSNNTYVNVWGKEEELTQAELNWFYETVNKIPGTKNIVITNMDHESANINALAKFYKAGYVTVDNYFIHEQYECCNDMGITFDSETIGSAVAKAIAGR